MDNIKKIFDNPMARKALIILGAFIVLLIVIGLISSCTSNKKYTYDELESKVLALAKSYYASNESSLPKNDGDTKTISISQFVTDGKIKSLTDILKDGSSCDGVVKVINNNGYYLYVPNLTCGSDNSYQTLSDLVTDSDNVVTNGNGLYATTDGYVFKGENVNNYVKFNDTLWRIVKVYDNGSIKVVNETKSTSTSWDNRYNIEKDSYTGINDYVTNDINSRVKDAIEQVYDKLDDAYKPYFITNELCTGKRSATDTTKDGSTECSTTLADQVFGLLQVNEVLNASLDTNCTGIDSESCFNYNYLADIGTTWLITADKDTTYKAYKLSGSGITLNNASNVSSIRVVGIFDSNVLYSSGNGSEDNPYIIQ